MQYINVRTFVDDLLARMQGILGEKLMGLYLYGSLVTGDFDEDISDIDLLAVTSSDIDEPDFTALDQLHTEMVTTYKQWEGRLEIAYLSKAALKTFRTQESPLAIISPGEPFHIVQAGRDWLMNWYVVRENGMTLFGPPAESVIDPITPEEFVQVVKEHTRSWQDWITGHDFERRPSQAYAILTMCRALYSTTHGEQVSKLQAASWTANEFPEWTPTIKNALIWRKAWREKVDDQATLPETRQFVEFATKQILG